MEALFQLNDVLGFEALDTLRGGRRRMAMRCEDKETGAVIS